MNHRNELQEMLNIIQEIIKMYEKNINALYLNDYFELMLFIDLKNLLSDYLDKVK